LNPKRAVVAVLAICLACTAIAKADFVQVSTSFGSQTALLDKGTGLDWLHWNLTAGISYDSMQAKLGPGGTFSGWRYATPAELTQLFVDFTGSPNGIVLGNDALTIQFLDALGGPLSIVDNPSTGFHREFGTGMLNISFGLGHANYGYIAIDNTFGAKITPELQGSTVDWYGANFAGQWLVREDPSRIPEPATISLLAVGLLCCMRVHKG